MNKSILRTLVIAFVLIPVAALSATIDRTFVERPNDINYYASNQIFYLINCAKEYYLDDRSSWESGAGSCNRARATSNSNTSIDGNIHYFFTPPDDGILLQQTDWNAGDHCLLSTLGIEGAISLQAELGARIGFINGDARILANETDTCNYYFYSASIGEVVPYNAVVILVDGHTWGPGTFNNSFRYKLKGYIDFADFSLIADAGPDLLFCINDDFVLNGSGSYDSNGAVSDYRWDLYHRSEKAFDLGVNGLYPALSQLEPGVYDVILTVTNDVGFIDIDTIKLTVTTTYRPRIYNVVAFQGTENSVEATEFKIGDMVAFEISCQDNDLDLATVTVTEYYPADSDAPYHGPYKFDLEEQSEEITTYVSKASEVEGPKGEWRLVFQLTDAEGFESNEFEVFLTVGGEPTNGGGGGSGGG